MFSLCFRSLCVSECVRSLSMCSVCVSECVRSMCQFVFLFQNVSDHSLDVQNVSDLMFSLCLNVSVSECVRSLSMFSLCFRMCQIALDVQFVSLNVSDHS